MFCKSFIISQIFCFLWQYVALFHIRGVKTMKFTKFFRFCQKSIETSVTKVIIAKRVSTDFMSLAVFCFVAFGFVPIFAGVKEDTIKVLQEQTKSKFEVISFEQLKGSKQFLLVLKDSANGYQSAVITDEKQKSIIAPIAFFGDKDDARLVSSTLEKVNAYNFKLQNAPALDKLFTSIPQDYGIKIQGASNKITYIVSDPMCVHCQQELANIESKLAKGSVVMILVGFLGQDSLLKSAEILSKIKSAKTPKEQISLLRNIYAVTHKATPQNAQYTSQVQAMTKKLGESNLIEAVPFIYEPLK